MKYLIISINKKITIFKFKKYKIIIIKIQFYIPESSIYVQINKKYVIKWSTLIFVRSNSC